MNTAPNKAPQPTRSGMPAFGAFSTTRASFLLEKNPGLRRSTPDSEALASSDDESEQTRVAQQALNAKINKSARRTSWLYEMPPSNRKPSNTMSGSYSPSTSHPATPSAENTSWTSNASPGLSGAGAWNASGSYPWGSIWNDNRKDPPSRLQEVLPSPTAMNPTAKFLSHENQHPALERGAGESAIPFSIPLQPTPKTYRSQSYSVGQLDTGTVIPPTLATASPHEASRSRFGLPSGGLQRRASRQGVLGDTGGLGRVREDDDNEEEEFEQHRRTDSQARMISQLERENAELRQAAQVRERTSSASGNIAPSAFRNTRIHAAVPEETDLAVDDSDDFQHGGASLQRLPLSSIENRNLENGRKAHWQTSLGFGEFIEPPQSRRHSFADVPTRHGSFSSTDRDAELKRYENLTQETSHGSDRESRTFALLQPSERQMEQEYLRNRHYAAQYFNNQVAARREAEAKVEKAFAANNPYGRYAGVGSSISPAANSLYIVNFKCNRSDVFYIQEGTGLQVKEGDLVIVEADRGTDLGAVQHAQISWEQARYFKEHYAEEHYKLLMMFSLQARNGGPNVVNPNGLQGVPGSAVGGMGPPGHHGSHESAHTDLKPKMIKRHAQQHEIQALQEKEGNEARAKRVCQQKVVDHGLNMEILDAEFQMDSKKLTFYYFADNYINFNSLVTDLFKIYKTRIWMSAINPASFVTPTASLAPPAYGGQAFGTGRQSPANRRRGQAPTYGQGAQLGYEDQFDHQRSLQAHQRPQQRDQFMGGYQGYGTQQASYSMQPFQGYSQAGMDPFTPYIPFQMLNANAPNFAPSQSQDARNRGNNQGGNNNWMNRFQGLSLGS